MYLAIANLNVRGNRMDNMDILTGARAMIECLTDSIELIHKQTHELHMLKIHNDIQSIRIAGFIAGLRFYADGGEDKGTVAKSILAADASHTI